jgi:hypothetical protein
MRRWSYRLAALATAAAAAFGAGGCGAQPSGPVSGANVFRVAERDFHISMPNRLPAGEVKLAVHNKGPDEHELIVIRRTKAGFPLRSDGATLNEEGLEDHEAGALEPGVPNKWRQLDVRLRPGRYLFLCNMAGHYLGGMYKEVEVR